LIKPTFRKIYLTVIVILLMTGIAPSLVMAHASLVRSDPADNANLAESPREIRLWFNEPISSQFSLAQLLNVQAQPVEISGIRVDPADPTLMILTLPELSPGIYSVRWKVLSEADGHFTQGTLVFGVGEQTDLSGVAIPEAEVSLPLIEVFLRWFNFGTLLALVGSIVVLYSVLAPTDAQPETIAHIRRAAQHRVIILATGCSALAMVIGIGLLLWQVSTLIDTLPSDVSFLAVGWQLTTQTRWGILWLVRQSTFLAMTWLLLRLHRPFRYFSTPIPTVSHVLLALLLLILLTVQALTGHAAALTPNTALAIVVDMLHLLGASMWVGGLLALVISLLPLLRREKAEFANLVRTSWRPFSSLAAISVGVLLATGLYNTGRQVASIDALTTTLYGQVLLGKVGLMALVGIFGLLNSILLHPWLATPLAWLLRRPSGWTPLSLNRLPALVLAEATVGVLVLLATGIVTASPPAKGPEFEVSPEDIPIIVNQTVDDMLITFAAKPNRPGQNIFSVRAVSSRRPPPAETLRVILRFTFLGQEMGLTSVDAVEIEPGLYQVGGNHLSLAGPWQVQVVVRRRGIEDTVAQFNWVVAPPGKARPVIISNHSLESPLTIAAALSLMMLVLITVAWVWLARHPWPGWQQRVDFALNQPVRLFSESNSEESDLKPWVLTDLNNLVEQDQRE